MKLSFDEATEAFRAEFSQWLDENLPDPSEMTERPRSTAHVPEWARRWQAKMFDAGWLLPGNPPEYGGRNAGLLEMFVHTEELVRRNIVPSMNPQGLSIVGPSILSFGTEEQKKRWAAPLLRADLTAALGMSEPNAGSDLAGLRTRAVIDGDDFVITGQKVWTSGAHDADFILAFVRTDPEVPKHKGISVVIVPTDTPGVERKPFGSIVAADDLDFNEVFFDEARVPRENLIGPLNGGWGVANGSLGHERAMLWLGYSERLETFLDFFADEVEGTESASDPRLVDWYGGVAMDAMALKLIGYRTLAQTRRGTPSREQSILKLFGSEASQNAYGDALEYLGAGVLDNTVLAGHFEPMRYDSMNQGWFDHYLRTFAGTIAGGTSEIQRNIIAEHVLGLPR